MMSKKGGKPVSWHVSYGPKNPRVNLNKLAAVNYVLADKEIDANIRMRIEKPAVRQVSIIISKKDFNIMKKDLDLIVKSKTLKYAGIFLYGQGVMVAEFITQETQDFRDKVTKGIPSEKDKEKEDLSDGDLDRDE